MNILITAAKSRHPICSVTLLISTFLSTGGRVVRLFKTRSHICSTSPPHTWFLRMSGYSGSGSNGVCRQETSQLVLWKKSLISNLTFFPMSPTDLQSYLCYLALNSRPCHRFNHVVTWIWQFHTSYPASVLVSHTAGLHLNSTFLNFKGGHVKDFRFQNMQLCKNKWRDGKVCWVTLTTRIKHRTDYITEQMNSYIMI